MQKLALIGALPLVLVLFSVNTQFSFFAVFVLFGVYVMLGMPTLDRVLKLKPVARRGRSHESSARSRS